MLVKTENQNIITDEGGMNMFNAKMHPIRHIPPHERKALMNLEFEEADWVLLKEIFGDEDTAIAAVESIKKAPPEIQILAIQLINIIEEVA